MTIALSANTPRVSYTVNQGATQTAFTVNFEFFDDSDLNFYVDGTLKTLTTHYTVAGGDGAVGTINTSAGNTVTGASGGSTVVITRDIALARTTDFPSSGAFQIGALNTELDRFVAIASDLNDKGARGIRLQDFDSAVSMELPLLDSRKGTVLGFNASTGAVEAGPAITAVQSLSAVTASINLLGTSAVVEDMGLLATSAVIEDMGLLGTSGNVTAMGLLGVSGVITDMGILGTTAIVEDMGFLGTSANVTAMGLLGNSTTKTAMGKLGNDATVADMAILGTDDVVADMNTLATSDIIADLNTLATSDIVTDMNLLATSGNVTAMGHLGTSANVTAMGLLGTSAVVTDMGLLGTTAVVEDMGLLATTAVIEDMGLLATSAVIEDVGLLATSAVIEDMGLLATSVVIEDMGLLATSANVTNMATLGASGVVGNIATVATGISGVNAFAARYRVASSDPSSDNDEGDLFYNTSDNTFKFFNGSAYVAVNVSGIGNIVEDTSPQLGGNLDGQDKNITTTGVGAFGSLDISGDVDVDGTLEADAITIDGTAIASIFSAIASPTFTGAPASTTASAGTNTTQIATTAFVKAAVDNAEPFPQGTSMLFQQTSAPTGWTKQTTHNDKAIRLTTGTVGTGGSVAFSTALGTPAVSVGAIGGNPGSNLAVAVGNLSVSMSGNVSDTTLSINQIPSHTHRFRKPENNGNTTNYQRVGGANTVNNAYNAPITLGAGGNAAHGHGHNISGSVSGAPSISGNTTVGNLAVASSTATINLQYVDFIIANKD